MKVTIKEVGPRDGLQNEKEILSSRQKIACINMLSNSGLSYIEAAFFSGRALIPQLNDAKEVVKGIDRKPGVTYAALVADMYGLEQAVESGIDEVSIFLSASETHHRSCFDSSVEERLPVLQEIAEEAQRAGKRVRGYVSAAFGCPFEGKIKEDVILKRCDFLLKNGIYEVSLVDTAGSADPLQVSRLLKRADNSFGKERFSLHFHDTRGMALANVLRSMDMGYTVFDAAIGGVGGCLYSKGAPGNVATDDIVHMLDKIEAVHGVDANGLRSAAAYLQNEFRKPLRSHQMTIFNGI